jgi:hypothetical protein
MQNHTKYHQHDSLLKKKQEKHHPLITTNSVIAGHNVPHATSRSMYRILYMDRGVEPRMKSLT